MRLVENLDISYNLACYTLNLQDLHSFKLFTDESLLDAFGLGGCGVYSPELNIRERGVLPNSYNIHEVQIFALLIAVQMRFSRQITNAVCFSDS